MVQTFLQSLFEQIFRSLPSASPRTGNLSRVSAIHCSWIMCYERRLARKEQPRAVLNNACFFGKHFTEGSFPFNLDGVLFCRNALKEFEGCVQPTTNPFLIECRNKYDGDYENNRKCNSYTKIFHRNLSELRLFC